MGLRRDVIALRLADDGVKEAGVDVFERDLLQVFMGAVDGVAVWKPTIVFHPRSVLTARTCAASGRIVRKPESGARG